MSATVHRLEPPVLDPEEVLAALDARLADLAGVAPPGPGGPVGWDVTRVVRRLSLDGFEQRALLLATAAELRGTTRDLVARFGPGPPTIGLLMRVCADDEPDAECWRALRPDGALRRARLLAVGEPHGRFTERPVWTEEPVLHALHGQLQLDEEVLAAALTLAADVGAGAPRGAVDRVAETLALPGGPGLVELVDDHPDRAVGVALRAYSRVGLGTVALPLAGLPRDPESLTRLRQAWLRDAVLHDLGLVLVGDGGPNPAAVDAVTGWGTPVVTVAAPLPEAACGVRVPVDPHGERHEELWRTALGDRPDDLADRLAFTFPLSPATIRGIGRTTTTADDVWAAARTAARPRDESLVERVEPRVRLDDVVLPDQVSEVLRALTDAGRGHHRVARDWGGDGSASRGLGITALFSGSSGTGKTMAAEAVARELGLDLYRVELSAVVSKYIGETERNLRRVFTGTAGGLLLFDEADALFGKRSEVRDSHDRYANLEIGYLLQQMESFRGIAVLTTNMPDALDSAFLRRLRFVARFPLPGATERRRIWESAFPAEVPCEPLDLDGLARLSLTGAVIRNIALGASFRAAGTGRPVRMADVAAAARMELVKLGRPLTEIDGRGWS